MLNDASIFAAEAYGVDDRERARQHLRCMKMVWARHSKGRLECDDA